MAMSQLEFVSKLTRILATHLPAEISSLEHVMKLIDDLLMAPENALIKAAANNSVEWFEHLLQSYNIELVDAIASAAASGHVDVIHRLMHDILEREQARIRAERSEYDDSSDDEDELSQFEIHEINDRIFFYQKVVVAVASTNGHLEIVQTFISQSVGSDEDDEAHERMFKLTWRALDEGAANGQFSVVKFAVEFAREREFLDHYRATLKNDALVRAVKGCHGKVVMYVTGHCDLYCFSTSPLHTASDVSENQRVGHVEWFYAISARYHGC
ncbi:hypothetical protein CCR75_009246 [Bremia lactucae]|uniref:Uncharacterized protein n=1 Tax=Bremia lactucae TaxID=4779 RepID=A0A976FJZ3_BRELC|nr:hypothetical protein CCR75_009246 [Bremia lactucae]